MSQGTITSFDWILFGFALHSLGGIFFYSSKPICYVLCGLALVIIFFNTVFRIPHRRPLRGIFSFLFFLSLVWNAFIIIRPFISNEPLIWGGFSLISPYAWLSLTIPLIVLLDLRQVSLKSIFKFSSIQGIIGLILLTLNYHNIFTAHQDFDSDQYQDYIGVVSFPLHFLSGTSFMLLCFAFVSYRNKVIAFLTMFLSVFTALFTARRTGVFMYGIIYIFTLFLYVTSSRPSSKVLRLLLVTAIIIFITAIFYTYAGSIFSLFFSRLDEDTRSAVEDCFLFSFKGKPLDWIIGRGINGTYYCSMFMDLNFNANRGTIETGYLYIILKGGLISLALFVILLVYSAYLGMFKTKNMLTKAMALYLVAHILFLVPYGLPAFDFEYLILWVCVLYCQSKEFRMCSDTEIKIYLNFT